MRSRLKMLKKEIGLGRGAALAAVSLGLYAAVALAILVANQPTWTGQALMSFVSPTAQASDSPPEQTSKPEAEVLPSSAQAKSWDKVEYGEHDFDPRPGQILQY